jgi:hypothetical protein
MIGFFYKSRRLADSRIRYEVVMNVRAAALDAGSGPGFARGVDVFVRRCIIAPLCR